MERSAVPALTRAMRIVELLAQEGQPGLGVSEIAARCEIAKSTTALLCSVLEEEGLLRRHDGRYRLGRRWVTLAGDYLATVDPLAEFYREVRHAPDLAHLPTRLGLLDGTDVLYLAHHQVGRARRLAGSVGDRFPASVTASGKAALSTLAPSAVEDRFRDHTFARYTQHSIQSLPQLLADLERCRNRGYALDQEETNLGQMCIAVPVATGTLTSDLAVSVTLSLDVAAQHPIEAVVAQLRAVADSFRDPLAGQSY